MRGFLQIFCDFANWSTVCGVPHIANAQTKLSRFFWSFIFICLVAVFGYQLFTMIVKFFKFPVMVTTDIFFQEQNFPVVTVCNFNPYKFAEVNSNSKFSRIKDLMSAYNRAVANTLTTDDQYGLRAVQNDQFVRDSRARDALVLLSAELTDDDKEPALYTFDDLISECSFAGKSCSRDDFKRFIDPVYGACYSFNENSNSSYTVQRAGMSFGLKLLLTVKQKLHNGNADFLPTTQLAGARISIHARGTHPSLESHGMNIGVGYQTAVSVVKTETERCKRPYGRCVTRESEGSDLFKDYTYTLETCFNGCRQRDTLKQCDCYNPRFPAPSTDNWCDISKLSCLQNLKGDQSNTANPNLDPLMQCGCDPPCGETNFFTTASLARYPSAKYYVATDSVNGAKRNDCWEWYRTNSLLLQVYFETLKYEKYTEKPSYGLSDIVNDLGGQAGLWLGLSVISVVEVCGLLMLICCYCVTCGGIRVRPSEIDIDSDERIKDIKEVEKEIDSREEHDRKIKKKSESEANQSSRSTEIDSLSDSDGY
ncbi:unnamed protein product [Auanema sp. JU1783]|nr:unnamed protein product [Auanema sp. JU1783]